METIVVPSAVKSKVLGEAEIVAPPPVPAHSPFGRRKQPEESWMPFAKVEVATPVWLIAKTSSPPAKVEVPAPSDSRTPPERTKPFVEDSPPVEIPPEKVEVAVEVELIEPTVRLPMDVEEK